MQDVAVICPLNGYAASERALPSAYDAASALGAPLHFFSAVEEPQMVDRRADYLAETAARTRGASENQPATSVVVDPHAPRAIAHVAASPNVFTVMATSSSPLLHTGYMGSAAERVARDAHNSVLLIGPHATLRLADVERVVVACDGSPLSEQVIGDAAAWATLLGVELWIVTAISPRDMKKPGYDSMVETNYVRRLATQVDAQWDVLHGANAAKTLVDWAGRSLIAMTTHGRSGLSRLTVGSVTVGATRWASAPILVSNGHAGVRDTPSDDAAMFVA